MLDDGCLFCKILQRKIPSSVVYETSDVLGFRDIHPQAPVHVLFIPKSHIPGVHALGAGEAAVVASLVSAAAEIANREKIADKGYRLTINCKSDGGQTVDHLHLHLLGGRRMGWPPG